MNKTEISQLLTVASGFDRRDADIVTVEAWALVPALVECNYKDALAIVVAHQYGPLAHEYLTVRHIVNALTTGQRGTSAQVAADVRSARARRMIAADWPESTPLPVHVLDQLRAARDESRELAESYAAEGAEGGEAFDLGIDLRRVPSAAPADGGRS